MTRLGIYGGTFDPPHLGHLILAAEAAEALQLDQVLWVITPDPPHKLNQSVSPLEVRLRLLQAALEGEARFAISRVDIDRPGPQYAADTLRLLKEQNPQAELFYLMGGDSLHDLPDWHQPAQLVSLASGLGVMRRPHVEVDLNTLEKRLPGTREKLCFIDAPLLDISSRDLRLRIQTGRPYRYFLPEPVWRMIEAQNLYRD
jgi:nicotinate-nucleotide adenylyltransferase